MEGKISKVRTRIETMNRPEGGFPHPASLGVATLSRPTEEGLWVRAVQGEDGFPVFLKRIGTMNRRGRPRISRMGTDRSEGCRKGLPSAQSVSSVVVGSWVGTMIHESRVGTMNWRGRPRISRMPLGCLLITA